MGDGYPSRSAHASHHPTHHDAAPPRAHPYSSLSPQSGQMHPPTVPPTRTGVSDLGRTGTGGSPASSGEDRILELPSPGTGRRLSRGPAREQGAPADPQRIPLTPGDAATRPTGAPQRQNGRVEPPHISDARVVPVAAQGRVPVVPGGAHIERMTELGDALQQFQRRLAVLRAAAKATGRLDRAEEEALHAAPPCPICHGAGYVRNDVPVGHADFGRPIPCVCKEREWRERERREDEERMRKLDRFFSLDAFNDKTFDAFNARMPGVQEAFNVARQYAELPQGWLVLRGTQGVGKTHLAAAIAHRHLELGNSVYFAVVSDLLAHLRTTFAPSSEVSYDEVFDTIREVSLLVLDDLGTQQSTPWAADTLFQLINHRYNCRIPTVITTNAQFSNQIDARIQSRLSDLGLVRTVLIKGQDYRPRNVPRAPGG